MPIHDHSPNRRGKAALWGGVGLGIFFVIALFTRGFGLFSGSGSGGEEQAAFVRQGDKIVVPDGSPLRDRLTVAAAAAEPVSATIVMPGIVESDPARTASVLPPLGGRVLELKVGLGERVTQGQVLAIINSPDLAQANDDNDKAEDTFKLTQKNLERQEGQFKIGTASSRDLDQARSDHAQATAEYTRTQTRLKAIGGSAETKDRSRLLAVRAPVSGSITTLSVVPGNLINDPTQPIMTIADLSTVWVTALVAEKDLATVSKDEDAEVRLTAYPDRVLHGKVAFVSDVVEPDSHRNKVRIAFANSDYTLKTNMFGTVTLAAPKQTRVVVPTSALLMNNDRTSVFVAVAPWTFQRRTVDPQLEEGSSVTIRSGLAAGEQIIVKGGVLLND